MAAARRGALQAAGVRVANDRMAGGLMARSPLVEGLGDRRPFAALPDEEAATQQRGRDDQERARGRLRDLLTRVRADVRQVEATWLTVPDPVIDAELRVVSDVVTSQCSS